MQRPLVQRGKRPHDRDEARRIDQEALAGSGRRYEHAGDRRPHGAGDVDCDRIEADGVADRPRSDHLEDERLAGRILERVVDAERKGEHRDLPDVHGAGDREDAEDQRLYAHRALEGDHQAPLVSAVRDDPAVGGEEQHRQRLERDHRAERGGRSGQLEDEPGLRGSLHPGPDE